VVADADIAPQASQISSFYFSVSYVKSSMSASFPLYIGLIELLADHDTSGRDIGLLSPGCIVLGLENVNLSYNLAALLVLESRECLHSVFPSFELHALNITQPSSLGHSSDGKGDLVLYVISEEISSYASLIYPKRPSNNDL
jgi:hypothetical protein